jgi:quinol monooxygenase YgiN
MSEQRPQQHIQIAEIEVDPAQLDSYKAAVTEQIEAAVRLEPGVLVLYSVSNKDNPAHVTVFEIYRDREAYLAHLQAYPSRRSFRIAQGSAAGPPASAVRG